MNRPSTLPEHLSEAEQEAIEQLVGKVEILPISCMFWRHDRNLEGVRPNRTLPDDFVYILTKGALHCKVREVKRLLRAGDFIMVPAGERHSVEIPAAADTFEVYSLHMHLYDDTRHRLLQKMDTLFGSLPDLNSWIARLAACTCLMGRSPEAGGAYMKQLVTLLLIDHLLRGHQLVSLPAEVDERIAKLLGQVREIPAEDWTVARMATCCHLSPSRFRQLFVATTGTAPKKYVQKVRLSLARSLLVTRPDLTVEQVAEIVGIADTHYFHAVYKARFGETPRQRLPLPMK